MASNPRWNHGGGGCGGLWCHWSAPPCGWSASNGLGATDVGRRGTTAGLFVEFRRRILDHYREQSGNDPKVMRDADDGHHFEPHVAEKVFEEMLAAEGGHIRVFKNHQFNFGPKDIRMEGGRVVAMRVVHRETGEERWVEGKIFVDASYEGDLAAAAGVPFRLGRESKDEFGEAVAARNGQGPAMSASAWRSGSGRRGRQSSLRAPGRSSRR